MAIQTQCEQCGFEYKLKDELAGKKVRCKICQAVFVVPPALPEGTEYSPAGNPIFRYEERKKDFELATGDEANIERIGDHIARYCGKVETVLHELISDLVHIDVHWVAPTQQRPFHTLVTSGMSDRPMSVPPGVDQGAYAELMLCLPPDWPMTQEAFGDENYYWPIRWLKTLARFPHEYETWLSWGHTLPNGDPPEPYAGNTQFCCAILLSPVLSGEGFGQLKVDESKTINFYSFVPLYAEEVDFKLQSGAEALVERFAKNRVTELVDIRRANVCKKKGWWS
jgi:hypothetical protein